MKYKLIKTWRKTLAIQIKNGEVIVRAPKLMPKILIENFVRKHEGWIEKKLGESSGQVGNENFHSLQDIHQAKLLAKKYIIPRVEYLAQKFNKNINQIKITSAKTRWGSCTSHKNINLSYRLMFTHSKAIDYVIIHELAHLKYMNHSKVFWSHVEEMMSDYKVWDKWLRDNGRNIG